MIVCYIVTMSTPAQKLAALKAKLEEYEAKRDEILATGQSWKLRNGEDSREMTNVSLAQISALIDETERKIEQLEGIVNGTGNPLGVRISARVL